MSNPNPYVSPESSGAPLPKDAQTTAPCPSCGHTTAQRIKWTAWGGALGPKLFSHVKCLQCGATFNAKKGTYNSTGIAIYITVSLVVGLAAGLMLARIFMR